MPPAAKTPATAPGLRVLVFGLPGSGKSSLLGALVQAATSQAAVLKGQLVDDSGRLAALRQATYAGTPPADDAEVVAYPVHFARSPQARPLAVTLLDCDGRLAQQYLTGRRPLTPRDSGLARAMLEADTVVLTLDAVAPGNQVEADLDTYRKFLALLQQVRGRRADVADLPVYLVLTKCDRLAKPDDPFLKWVQRIEEAKRKLGDRFAAFLADDPAGPPFGTIDLNLWATAVRRPALADRPAQDAEPYGVAELFRQCLESAEAFDGRERRAGRKLEWAVGGMGLLVIVLALLAALFAATQPDTTMIQLEEQVQAALPEPPQSRKTLPVFVAGTVGLAGTPVGPGPLLASSTVVARYPADTRLHGPLKERLAQLMAVQEDPNYPRLPEATRGAVRQAAGEVARYLEARQEVQQRVRPAYQAKDEAEFNRFEKQAYEFSLPPEYAWSWVFTRLPWQLAETRRAYADVRRAVADEVAWVHGRIDEGKRLQKEGLGLPPELADPARAKDARKKADAWFTAAVRYMNQPYLRRPGDEPIPGTLSFTYSDLRKFEAVRQARKEWDEAKLQLDKTFKFVSTFLGK